ncbi:hypothetical protein L9F63_011378, partial [Diploptera punctata]
LVKWLNSLPSIAEVSAKYKEQQKLKYSLQNSCPSETVKSERSDKSIKSTRTNMSCPSRPGKPPICPSKRKPTVCPFTPPTCPATQKPRACTFIPEPPVCPARSKPNVCPFKAKQNNTIVHPKSINLKSTAVQNQSQTHALLCSRMYALQNQMKIFVQVKNNLQRKMKSLYLECADSQTETELDEYYEEQCEEVSYIDSDEEEPHREENLHQETCPGRDRTLPLDHNVLKDNTMLNDRRCNNEESIATSNPDATKKNYSRIPIQNKKASAYHRPPSQRYGFAHSKIPILQRRPNQSSRIPASLNQHTQTSRQQNQIFPGRHSFIPIPRKNSKIVYPMRRNLYAVSSMIPVPIIPERIKPQYRPSQRQHQIQKYFPVGVSQHEDETEAGSRSSTIPSSSECQAEDYDEVEDFDTAGNDQSRQMVTAWNTLLNKDYFQSKYLQYVDPNILAISRDINSRINSLKK